MPTYHIEMMEGRTVEQKKKLVEEITRVSVEILGGWHGEERVGAGTSVRRSAVLARPLRPIHVNEARHSAARKNGSLPFRVEHYSSNKSIDTREQEPSRCKKRCSAKRWGLPRPGL